MSVDFEIPYWIIDTDYNGYAVIFSCRDMAGLMGGRKRIIYKLKNMQFNYFVLLGMVWILARQPVPGRDLMERAYAALDRNKISKAYLMHTDQSNCLKTN